MPIVPSKRRKLQGSSYNNTGQQITSELSTWGAKYGIGPDHLAKLGIVRVTQDDATALLKYEEGRKAPAAGYLIPYFDIDGKKTNFFRIRFDEYLNSWAKVTGRKAWRYAQPKDSGIAIYFDPSVRWRTVAANTCKRVLITEGEMKAACAVAHGFVCIGLGGVSSWRGTSEGKVLHPQLRAIDWKGREACIVYDSDAAYKADVQREEQMLAAALAGAGAKVKIVRLPQEAA